jgi:hypothetical protein
MITVCAWCQKFLGVKEPLSQADVSHGICPACSARQQIRDFPVLVVSRTRLDTLPVLEGLLQGTPEIRIVVDRRVNDRRRQRPAVDIPGGRRMLRDRRERLSLVLT